MNGVVLVSPYLDPGAYRSRALAVAVDVDLATIVAANLERQGKLTDATMAEVIEYTRDRVCRRTC